MEEFTFHGPISIDDVARALEGEFGVGNLRVQVHGDGDFIVLQIASVARPASVAIRRLLLPETGGAAGGNVA